MEEQKRDSLTIKQKLIGREFDKFYSAKGGTGWSNLDQMADAIENLCTLVSNDIEKDSKGKAVERIKEVLLWYRTLERNPKCYTSTREGKRMKSGVYFKANEVLTKYFTIIKNQIENLGLMK